MSRVDAGPSRCVAVQENGDITEPVAGSPGHTTPMAYSQHAMAGHRLRPSATPRDENSTLALTLLPLLRMDLRFTGQIHE
jgi:hypothetical protein